MKSIKLFLINYYSMRYQLKLFNILVLVLLCTRNAIGTLDADDLVRPDACRYHPLIYQKFHNSVRTSIGTTEEGVDLGSQVLHRTLGFSGELAAEVDDIPGVEAITNRAILSFRLVWIEGEDLRETILFFNTHGVLTKEISNAAVFLSGAQNLSGEPFEIIKLCHRTIEELKGIKNRQGGGNVAEINRQRIFFEQSLSNTYKNLIKITNSGLPVTHELLDFIGIERNSQKHKDFEAWDTKHFKDSEAKILQKLENMKESFMISLEDHFPISAEIERFAIFMHLHTKFDPCPCCAAKILWWISETLVPALARIDRRRNFKISLVPFITSNQSYEFGGVKECRKTPSVQDYMIDMSLMQTEYQFQVDPYVNEDVDEDVDEDVEKTTPVFHRFCSNVHELISQKRYYDLESIHPEFLTSRDLNLWTPLHVLAQIQDREFILYVIKRTKAYHKEKWHDVFLIKNKGGDTTLHVAVNHNNQAFLETLLSEGFPWWIFNYVKGSMGNTLLHTAAAYSSSDTICFLLGLYQNRGEVDYLNKQTDEGFTPHYIAHDLRERNEEIVNLVAFR